MLHAEGILLMNTKVMIAGGAGYIGAALVPVLQERGYDLVVVDTLWFGNYLPEGTPVIQKSVFDLQVEDLEGVDQVIFLAGLSNDPMAEYSPSQNFISNAAAPAYLGYIAKQANVSRFVFAGTCSVYGYTVNELYDESYPVESQYPYGISKLQGEQAVMQMAGDNFSVISLRKGTVCGYSPRMRLDLIVNTMFRTAMQHGEIVIHNPEIWRPIVSIRDTVSAYVRAIEANQKISGIFNIASDNYTVGEIADIVKMVVEENIGSKIKLKIENRQDYRNYKVSTGKAEKVLSFKPKHDIEFIVNELLAHQAEFCDWDNPSYYNIEVFKTLCAAEDGLRVSP